jgi:hypothetical protein
MRDDHFAQLGEREIWGRSEAFGLSTADRRQHLYCVGKTGTGKSTLLRNLILQDIEAGQGVGLIDPHGDLAKEILDLIPPWRTNHVVYFNPADLGYPVGFNLLRNVAEERRPRVASGIVGAMKSIWQDSWGARMEYILYAAIAALLDCENSSILGVQRMLVDARYRKWVVRQIKNPMVKSFWTNEFEQYGKSFRQEAIAPIQNKIGQFIMASPVRNVLGQVLPKLDLRFVIDNRRIFIANLSKGLLGEDKANLLGSLLVAGFELAAMERVEIPEAERSDYFLFVDEFHNFATDSFAAILAEARKFRLCLTLSHQYLNQVRESIRHAVFGNVGSLVSFRVGESDAKTIAEEFGSGYTPGHFSSLGNFEAAVKLLTDGEHRQPFTARTLPPLHFRSGRRDTVARRSREKYAIERHVVEGKIHRFMNQRLFG